MASLSGRNRPSPDESSSLTIYVKENTEGEARGLKRALTVKPWSTVKDIKDQLSLLLHVPASLQLLYFGPSLPLKNSRTLADVGVYRSGETLLFGIRTATTPTGPRAPSSRGNPVNFNFPPPAPDSTIAAHPSLLPLIPKPLRRLVEQARRALSLNLKPELAADGSGGVYFLRAPALQKVAVFKPADEEPYAPNNPRGYVSLGPGTNMRSGVTPGQACYREVAAFLLDHGGFSGVPMTTLCEARHPAFSTGGAALSVAGGGAAVGLHSVVGGGGGGAPLPMKLGSFQAFARGDATMDDLSPSVVPQEEAEKVAVLDLRIMNADRNGANLIARRTKNGKTYELIPIDHGFCLRKHADVGWCDWCWLDWAQLKKPVSKRTRSYVLKLDVEKDATMLKDRLGIDDAALDLFRASSNLLIAGVKAGLTLYEIASMACRLDDAAELPSRLEVLLTSAAELSYTAVENQRWHHKVAATSILDQLRTSNSPPPPLPAPPSPQMLKAHRAPAALPSVLATSSEDDSAEEMGLDEDEGSPSDEWRPSSPAPPLASPNPEMWASAAIETTSRLSVVIPPPPKRNRSSSNSSEASSASRSPGGFWIKRPTSPIDRDASLSFATSPTSADGSFDADELIPGLSLDHASPKARSRDDAGLLEEVGRKRASCLSSFQSATNLAGDLERELRLSEVEAAPPPSSASLLPPPLPLKRSQSYSAFSSSARSPDATTDPLNSSATVFGGKDKEALVREYFKNILALMLENEIKAHCLAARKTGSVS